MNPERVLLAVLCLLGAFLVYVSMTEKVYKGKELTYWQKMKLYFHICPCGGKVGAMSWGKYKCWKCGESYTN